MPKFLWTHIIDYLPANAILKMIIVAKNFDKSINDNGWKRCFYGRIGDPIVIVKCRNKRIDNFWYHAYYNYICCDDLDYAFSMIDSDNNLESRYKNIQPIIYYKIFIADGEYEYNCDRGNGYTEYRFNRIECSIDIIGSGNHDTIMIANYDYSTSIICPYYFSIKNIVLHGINFVIRRQNNNNCINGDISQLELDNCIFRQDNDWIYNYLVHDTKININSIDNILIHNCMFDHSQIYIDNKDANTNYPYLINCTIKSNLFENNDNDACINIDIDCDQLHKFGINWSSVITITDNVMSKSNILYRHKPRNDEILVVDGNTTATI